MTNDALKTARCATLDELLQNVIPAFINPPPTRATLRAWFDREKIPRFKSNPLAKRGGGASFYSVAHVEKFFRSRTIPKIAGVA
jgi:hypothetical protein